MQLSKILESIAYRQTLKGWKGIFHCSHCPQGCGGCAESCQQLWGKPANSFGTPRRHLRAVQTSARTENRKQLFCDPRQLGGEAVCKKLRRTTVTSTCNSCRAGYAAPTCSFCRIEINTLVSIFYCSQVNIFSTIFRPRLQFSPPCPYFLSRRSVSNLSQRHSSDSNFVQSKNMFTQLTPAPFIPDNTFVSNFKLSVNFRIVKYELKKVQKKMQRYKQ